jgi:hypothetical protein
MKSATLRLLFPELTWERHAVMFLPGQCQRHLVPSAHAIHFRNDLIPGEISTGATEIVNVTIRPLTHRVKDSAVNEHVARRISYSILVTRLVFGHDKERYA